MRITLIAVTRRPAGWLQAGTAEYLKRMPRQLKVELVEVQPVRATGATNESRRREADRIRAATPSGRRIIVLDEHGTPVTSMELARRLKAWMRQGVDPAFIVGGADGLDASVTDAAHETWALSGLTLPHGLARLLLVEQLYRASTIIANHPYHRA
jgi:23S rRNA (pseudouridine1915-N3)-methyltransferase